jgi:hypothetical protein
MRAQLLLLAALMLCAMTNALADAPESTVQPLFTAGPVSWGAASQSLQCGVQMQASFFVGFKKIRFSIKNVSSAPVTLYEDTLDTLQKGFQLSDAEPNQPKIGKVSFDSGESSVWFSGNRRQTNLAPGEIVERQYQVGYDKRLGNGSYNLTFVGEVQPLGVARPLPLSCGPVPFHT